MIYRRNYYRKVGRGEGENEVVLVKGLRDELRKMWLHIIKNVKNGTTTVQLGWVGFGSRLHGERAWHKAKL